MRTPHIEADYHLQLRPGTNVALINALAHVIVTEGLVEGGLRRASAASPSRSTKWRAFVAEARELARGDGGGHRRAGRRRCARAARLYATGGNGAIYYGLGVTEHSQGSTMVMGIANLAMATGNLGREGVGVNPLRGQNNVQGSCDMGSFPHEFPATATSPTPRCARCSRRPGACTLQPEPGLRIPNMFEAALDGSFKGLYIEGEDIAQSDPNTQHVTAALTAMECIIVQDLFLNETAKFAHVFLPGSSFLEKDGTFTNAERRISRVRKVMPPQAGYADWEVTQLLSNALGYPMNYTHPSRDHGRDRAPDADLHRRQLREARRLGSIQWPCNDAAPGRHADDARRRVRARQGHASCVTEYVPTDEKVNAQLPADPDHRPHPRRSTTSARRRGAPQNIAWHDEDRLEIHPHDAEERGISDGDWVGIDEPRRRDRAARDGHRAHAAGRRLHDLPLPRVRRQRHHHRQLRLGDQLPRVQGDGGAGDAGQPAVGVAEALTRSSASSSRTCCRREPACARRG